MQENKIEPTNPTPSTVPQDGIPGLLENWSSDLLSGLLVSLIALPLCLGIALASGFPAFGGIVTAIIGGLIVGPLCGSRLTIKGPAAGLIAVAIGCVETLGNGDLTAGYKYTLGIIVIAGAVQILFALFKLGRFGDFFPVSVVHGMLASIGIIIFSKQVHALLGVKPIAKEPLGLLAEIPHSLVVMNPDIACVGAVSVVVVLLASSLLGRVAKYFPGPLLAVISGVALGLYFDVSHPHTYTWYSMTYFLDSKFLVDVPSNFFMGVTTPDFSKAFTLQGLPFILMFSMIGSLESLLTVKAVDNIEIYRRRSDMNRDLLAVGVGNILAGLVGGLPMISEVVRSYANVSYGAKTRWANVAHGAFLLLFVVLLSSFLKYIPTAALAGVLCVVGYRLASPQHFKESKQVGAEQLLIFTTTCIAILISNDLLVGVALGILLKYVVVLFKGATFKQLITSISDRDTKVEGDAVRVCLPGSCFFGNVIGFKKVLDSLESKNVILDFSATKLVDHTFMKEVRRIERDRVGGSSQVRIEGLDRLCPVSEEDTALRHIRRNSQSTFAAV